MIKDIADALSSVGKAMLLLAIPVYLSVDAVRLWVSDGYRTHREARQERLCFDLYDEETNRGDPVAEAMRQANLPRSLFGKLDLFLQCATITEIGLGGVKLQRAEQAQLAALAAANAAGAQAVAEAYMAELESEPFVRSLGAAVPPASGQAVILWPPQNGVQAIVEPDFGSGFSVDDGRGHLAPVVEEDPMRSMLESALDEAVRSAIERFDPEAILNDPAFNAFEPRPAPEPPG